MKSCIICHLASKYTCPHCKINYCSINCYKIHKDNCSSNATATEKDKLTIDQLDDYSQAGVAFKQLCRTIMESNDPRLELYKSCRSNDEFNAFIQTLKKELESNCK